MNPCILCSSLADEEYGRQKFGWPDHEYLMGTEDEQVLKRLTPEQANEILHEP